MSQDPSDLEKLLSFAAARSPFYRDCVGDDIRLESFPILSQVKLRTNLPHLLTLNDGAEREKLLERLTQKAGLSASRSEERIGPHAIMEQTSGTSGIPLRVVKTYRERLLLGNASWLCRRRFDPDFRPGVLFPFIHRAWNDPLPNINTPAEIVELYTELIRRGVRWIHTFPSLLRQHVAVLKESGLFRQPTAIRYIETSGEFLAESLADEARLNLQVMVVNQFGTRELWSIGYSLGDAWFQINEQAVYVELVDDAGHPITEEGIEGAVVATSKILRLMPIIRYRTGDRGCWRMRDGKRLLELSRDRQANMFLFDGRWVSGRMVFRRILEGIYEEFGYPKVDFIQIRKMGPHRLKLMVACPENAPGICESLKARCRRFDPQVEVDLEQIDLARAPAGLKSYLFINEYDNISD